MDYSKLSDFDINAAVFEALHGGAPDYKEGDVGAMILISYEGDVVGGDAVEVEVERGVFNPCNIPADAWSIIAENRISIFFDETDPEYEGTPYQWCSAISICQTHQVQYLSNPLRAAMIVFLMMQDSK